MKPHLVFILGQWYCGEPSQYVPGRMWFFGWGITAGDAYAMWKLQRGAQ